MNSERNALTVRLLIERKEIYDMISAAVYGCTLSDSVNADVTVSDHSVTVPPTSWYVLIADDAEEYIDFTLKRALFTRPVGIRSFECFIDTAAREKFKADAAPAYSGKQRLFLDDAARTVHFGGAEAVLTKREYSLFKVLMSAEGKPVAREELESAAWNETGSGSNIVDVYIAYLRRKLRSAFGAEMIITVRGKGYMLADGIKTN